ncbi:membrane protein [Stutzerimonas stutzeri]|uniref:Membrane protein n=1 Tax=Stutzerimonas stutzeri TaxID=316 RepID=W8R732_STUST|nr:DUF805 domain-containing protein [Stutzerimonas stutzeri]AHL74107.1 membrane protein [Stutzerimonas stutzeri]MCQ4331803.1 DUF805 domain-containing protein [Stutzerimonas stutzeri]
MSAEHYRIVFDGELVPGMSADTVRNNLARLFKSDADKVERLFSHGPVNIKRDLSALEADRYLQALLRAGARARKEPEASRGLTLSLIDYASTSPSQASATADQMECPKCGHSQPTAIQCESCGIVIQKYLARQAQQAEASKQSEIQAAAQPYAPPLAQIGEPAPQYGELKVFTIQGRIGRLRYLAWSMSLMSAALGLLLVASMAFAVSAVLGSILSGILCLGLLFVSMQICVQRLHDIGWSGWLMLLNLVPIAGNLFSLAMLLMPGNDGMNRFGPPQPPNSRAVKILASLWLLVPVIGIVAAIALPAYLQRG